MNTLTSNTMETNAMTLKALYQFNWQRAAAFLATIAVYIFTGSVYAAQTTGGVNWLDPLGYKKPAFYPISVPDEAAVTNKYWVDLGTGAGTSCTNAAPCSWSTVQGKPGVKGGPAYIYIKGTGPIGSPTIYGSAGNEVVVKPWNDSTRATITGRNNWTTRQQYVIWDGGPNLNIKFNNTTGGQFDPSVYFNASSVGTHSNITLYRTQWDVTGQGEWIASWGTWDNLKIINSEFYSTSAVAAQHHIYPSAGSNFGPMTNFLILNNIFRDTHGEAIEFRVVSQSVSGVVIDGNAFHNIGKGVCSTSWKCRSAITLATNGGTIGSVRISNNLIWDTGEGAVRCWAGNANIYNNTVYNWGMGSPANGGYGQWAFFGYSRDGSCTVKNNIIYAPGKTSNGYTKIPFDSSPNINSNASNNICPSGQNCGGSSQVFSASTLLSTDPLSANFLLPNLSNNLLAAGINLSSSGVNADYLLSSRSSNGAYVIGAVSSTAPALVAAPLNLRIQ